MINKLLFLVFSFSIFFVFTGCSSDEDKELTLEEKKNYLCEQDIDCDPSTDYEDCMDEYDALREDFVEEYYLCATEATCLDYDDNSEYCLDRSDHTCTTDKTDFFEDICYKDYACDGVDNPSTEDIDNCVNDFHNEPDLDFFGCFKSSILDSLGTCCSNCECSTIDTCMDTCITTVIY